MEKLPVFQKLFTKSKSSSARFYRQCDHAADYRTKWRVWQNSLHSHWSAPRSSWFIFSYGVKKPRHFRGVLLSWLLDTKHILSFTPSTEFPFGRYPTQLPIVFSTVPSPSCGWDDKIHRNSRVPVMRFVLTILRQLSVVMDWHSMGRKSF